MGRATSKGNEAKSKMKHPSDMPLPRFEHGRYWSVVQHATARPRRCPYIDTYIHTYIHTYIYTYTWRHPKVMKRSQRWNTLQICYRRDSDTGGSDLWSNALLLGHGGALTYIHTYIHIYIHIYIDRYQRWGQINSGIRIDYLKKKELKLDLINFELELKLKLNPQSNFQLNI